MEPLATLRDQRSGRVLGWEQPADFKGSVFYGTNLVAKGRGGVVRVGDAVRVTQLREGQQWKPN